MSLRLGEPSQKVDYISLCPRSSKSSMYLVDASRMSTLLGKIFDSCALKIIVMFLL